MSADAETYHDDTPGGLTPAFWANLMAQPWRYDLFQLLRHIDARGGSPWPLGRGGLPRHESVRLGQQPSLSFAPSNIAGITPRDGSPLYDIAQYGFGLFGPNGPLPLHLTEYVRERVFHHQDRALLAFVDLFHHRLLTLFYRAWADAQPAVSPDRADNQRFNHYLASLQGAAQHSGQTDSINRHAPLFFTGHLIRHGRDPQGLENILRHAFALPVRIIENLPCWLPIETDEQACLKAGKDAPRLGANAFLGIAARDVQHKFRIELGPMSRDTYRRFLPGGALCRQLRDWVRRYLGIEYQWDVRLILQPEHCQGARLGDGDPLGLSTWLGAPVPPDSTGALIFTPEACPDAFSAAG
ncbi:type VI secretion system baseplate subunit TssG [Entomohabitans teleogrylli]|uniref:type VI secretion system baseplate subunit TssG n=1 Tax=Entomohabitans teleogrylli TaxID=1384589 RepID=UPI00073DAD92|nr:type VI secretion system baseplate subunit TssG [Entomohabitans teleogrylli]